MARRSTPRRAWVLLVPLAWPLAHSTKHVRTVADYEQCMEQVGSAGLSPTCIGPAVPLAFRAAPGRAAVHFLHIPKAAGNSIERLMLQKEQGSKAQMAPPAAGGVARRVDCSWWHTPPRFMRPNPYAATRTLCVARDPLDRLVSHWKMFANPRDANDSAVASAWLLARLDHERFNLTTATTAAAPAAPSATALPPSATVCSGSGARRHCSGPAAVATPRPPMLLGGLGRADAMWQLLYEDMNAYNCHLLPTSIWVWGDRNRRAALSRSDRGVCVL